MLAAHQRHLRLLLCLVGRPIATVPSLLLPLLQSTSMAAPAPAPAQAPLQSSAAGVPKQQKKNNLGAILGEWLSGGWVGGKKREGCRRREEWGCGGWQCGKEDTRWVVSAKLKVLPRAFTFQEEQSAAAWVRWPWPPPSLSTCVDAAAAPLAATPACLRRSTRHLKARGCRRVQRAAVRLILSLPS